MTKKFRQLSLQAKMSSIFILVNLVVFAVTVILILGINSMSSEIDMVYQGNLRLNELSDALTAVQDSMTEYLDSKTSDSLEEFYRSEQIYAQMVQGLSDDVTEATFRRMERSIRHMSEEYLDLVGQTIEAKRGRNVEKYRVRYENATQMYEYINTYIYSLNNEQFRSNSENYSRLSVAFRSFELFSVITLTIVAVISVAIVVKLTGEIISPLKRLTVMANEVAGENFDTELLPVQSEDEIGVVTGAFNQMVISIRQYLERLRQSMEIQRSLMEKELLMESHLKDAQLKYLQAQINPHFLFNTLNAGAQLAMMEGADRTYDYIQNVADFFRYNVKKGNDIVTLREELELIDHYIYILNVRFSGDIHYEKEISEDLLDCAVPSMILQPIVVGGQTFKNRIMFPPLTTGYEKNGMISEQDMGFYTRLAKGGVGYIVMGDVAPINSFSPTPKLFDDSQIPAFKALADSVHAYGTKLGVQIFHPEYDVDAINSLFMQKKFDEMRQRLHHDMMFFTDEVSEEMLMSIIDKMCACAVRAQKAGVDVIQIHGDRLNGCLCSTRMNHRTDKFGGSLENRVRFARMLTRAIRKAVPDMVIDYKLSIVTPQRGKGGIDEADAVQFAQWLVEDGVDMFHVAQANHTGNMADTIPPMGVQPYGFFVRIAGDIKKAVNVPVSAVGRIVDAEMAERVIESGMADMVAVGRPLLADPDWGAKIAAGKALSLIHI